MAAGYIVKCNHFDFDLFTWDEGNPYVEFPKGKRHYFYHPDGDFRTTVMKIIQHKPSEKEYEKFLEKTGNASDHLCLDCGAIIKLNPDVDKIFCSKCSGTKMLETWNINGEKCPFCAKDILIKGEKISAIS